jgi:hypothetical protein
MPEQAEFHMNLGTVLADQGQHNAAIACYDRSLELRPASHEARWRRGMARLAMGQFAAGWADYATHESTSSVAAWYSGPQWSGEPLAGRTLLLHNHQGLGDTLQFIRYVKLIQPDGKLMVAVQPELIPLLRQSGFANLVPNDVVPPPFDTQAALLSLPHVFHTELDNVPCDVPYLAAAPDRLARWEGTLRRYQGLKVGIVWQGRTTFRGDRLRSVPLSAFAPLAELENVHLISLQRGVGRNQLANLDARFNVIDLGEQLDHEGGAFMDTAAVMEHLDLVITSDTAVAHLAGALGVRVWVALAAAAEWRWMTRREDSPWYPTMRLFRQSRPVHWVDVFKRMAVELEKLRGQ